MSAASAAIKHEQQKIHDFKNQGSTVVCVCGMCVWVCVFQRGDSSWHQMRSKQQDHTPEASVDLLV